MRCPRCGAQNPDDAQICASCSSSFPTTAPAATDSKPVTPKMIIASVMLEGLAMALMLFVRPTLAFIAALLGAFSAIKGLTKLRESKHRLVWKIIGITVTVFGTLHVLLLSYWCIDAAPIPDDYTISDIRSAPPHCNQTYQLLLSLADDEPNLPNAPAIGLSEQDLVLLKEIDKLFKEEDDYAKICAGLEANAENILQMWQDAQRGRDVFTRLEQFPEIADQTQPYMEVELRWLKNLRCLVSLRRAYVCLQSLQGNEEIAVRELIESHLLRKKLSSNARSLTTNLVCMAWSAFDIQAANFIANNPQTSQEFLNQLAEHFAPLQDEYLSLKNSLVFEYLMFRNEFEKISKPYRLKYMVFAALKFNSSLRVYRNMCDGYIAREENRDQDKKLRVWPLFYPNLPVTIDSDGNFPWYYKAYNPIGSVFVAILMPAIDRVYVLNTKTRVHYDLLQIVLNRRLDKDVGLKARAYSDEYIIDIENKKIFSPGPDGKANTKDDISLPINPEVLNWAD